MSKQEYNDFTTEERRHQIECLLTYPRIGPLPGEAIVRNLGASAREIDPILDALVADGWLRCLDDGRYAPAGGEEVPAG